MERVDIGSMKRRECLRGKWLIGLMGIKRFDWKAEWRIILKRGSFSGVSLLILHEESIMYALKPVNK